MIEITMQNGGTIRIELDKTAAPITVENFEKLAALDGTLVFLMGLSNLEKICSGLMENGKDKNTPAAVISGGNSKNKTTVRAALGEIAAACRREGVKSPVTIVIGPVASLDLRCE